jgi:NADPH:quinone reductase-like Zn-dependent oxidoreductase
MQKCIVVLEVSSISISSCAAQVVGSVKKGFDFVFGEMFAVTSNQYGPADTLKIGLHPLFAVQTGYVRVKVHASSVTTGDVKMRGLQNTGLFWLPLRIGFGILRPRHKIPGMDFSGIVQAVGWHDSAFEVGDEVFGTATFGAHAQFVDVKEDGILTMSPYGKTHFEAAATPFGGLAALYFLRDLAKVKVGEHVAIVGACGSVGSFAVQLAKKMGCKVSAICNDRSTELAKSLGADEVLGHQHRDLWAASNQYDVILDTIGTTKARICRRALKPNGRHVFVNFGIEEVLESILTPLLKRPRVLVGFSAGSKQDLETLRDTMEEGGVKPVIDSIFGLDDIVAAHKRVETGHKHGAVILQIAQ